jgi:S1-C subfamily serine protease
MSDPSDPDAEIPLQPRPDKCAFDLHETLASMVSLRCQIPEDALTAGVLGTERIGHGAVIADDGLIVTIGYLITEAESLWISTGNNVTVPGHVVGYDQESGLGLVQALQPMGAPSMSLGRSAELHQGDEVVVAGHGGLEHAIEARVIGKREFAGYWEYVLDEAIFTAPAHPNWGGAGLIGADGRLLGIGSLLVQQVAEGGEASGANMIVPIDLLAPILDDLRMYGKRNQPPRPWIGFLVQELSHHLVVSAVYDQCPADDAGLRVGDIILEVDGEPVGELAELFRQIWQLGDAGVTVPLTILRNQETSEVHIQSTDRANCLKAASVH